MTRLLFLTYITDVIKRTDKNTQIYEALNDTISDIASRRQFQDYSFQSYTNTVVRQEDYPLPTTLLHIQHPIRLLEGSDSTDTGWNLKQISKEEYDLREPNPNRTTPTTGRPTAYCIYSGSILLTPLPDLATYLIEINWGNAPTDMSADADTPSFNSVWDEVLKFGTLYRMFALLGMYEPDSAYWENKYEIGIRRMIDRDRDKSGHLFVCKPNND